jgi:O-methyltransferase
MHSPVSMECGLGSPSTAEELYLDLLKRCLTRSIFPEQFRPVRPRRGNVRWYAYRVLRYLLERRQQVLMRRVTIDPNVRSMGRDWPDEAETMVGLRRLDNLQFCITDVLRREVPGDLIETGVWRGGASIFMRGVLKAYRDTGRCLGG